MRRCAPKRSPAKKRKNGSPQRRSSERKQTPQQKSCGNSWRNLSPSQYGPMTKQGLQLLLQYVARTSRRHGVYPNPFRSSPITGPPSIPFRINTGSVDILPDEGMPQAIEVVGKTEQQGLANLYR